MEVFKLLHFFTSKEARQLDSVTHLKPVILTLCSIYSVTENVPKMLLIECSQSFRLNLFENNSLLEHKKPEEF